jgi:hypothetical protein
MGMDRDKRKNTPYFVMQKENKDEEIAMHL